MTSTPTPRRAAGIAPNPAASPGSAVPRGRTGQAGPPGAPVPGGLATHPSQSPRVPRSAAQGTPDPATAARGLRGVSAAGRVRAQAPAGGAADADTALPAGQRAIAAAMSEDRGPDSLDAHVVRLIDDLGLWSWHNRNPIGSRKGWPDRVIFGAGLDDAPAILFRELKSERGTLKPDQKIVRDKILAAGGNWALWTPADLLSGRIAAELTAISGLRGTGAVERLSRRFPATFTQTGAPGGEAS
jgi:hypothetical protein